jgi:uncharacterized protein
MTGFKTRAAAIVVALGTLCSAGCAAENSDTTDSSRPDYTLDTPLDVIGADPRGEIILTHDAANVLDNQHYQISGDMSLNQIAKLSGANISRVQLAQLQSDLAALSAEEHPGEVTAASTYTPAAPVYTASFTCEDGNTPVQNAVCGNQQLAALDVQLAALYWQHLGTASVFEQDQLLAAQRVWLLSLPGSCGVTATANPGAVSCLATAYQAQIAALTNWSVPQPTPGQQSAGQQSAGQQSGAIGHYLSYKMLDDGQSTADSRQPGICAAIAGSATGALADNGAIDPTRLDWAQEIAGTHGPASGPNPQGGSVAVDMYRAGLYGGYQIRARTVSLSGATAPLLGPSSVGDYVQSLPNGGGRYVSAASQTGDYGDIDVFTYHGHLLALITDTIGYNSPAPPGEAAVAAVFTINQGTAQPTCLYETYLMPPPLSMGTFGAQPSLTPFLALIDQIQGAPSGDLAPSDRQDTSYLSADTRWTMLNMPLVTLAQARAGSWTGWLRNRHDQVLDTLYTWSQKSPQNQAMFNQLFTLLQPAAVDLDKIYVQQQGMNTGDAQQATALAMMELLYQSTINFAPGLGSGPADPARYKTYAPRYPILANPQS